MTVGESVALGSEYPRQSGLISWPGVREMAKEALKNVAPHIDVNDMISGLSRADRSLVAIARALYAKSDVLVLDEPTASLDPDTADKVRTFFEKFCKKNNTAIILASHNMEEVTRLCDNVIMMKNGKITDQGTPNSLLKKYGKKK